MKRSEDWSKPLTSGGEIHVPSLSRSELLKEIKKREKDLAKFMEMGAPEVGVISDLKASLEMLKFFLAKKDEK